MQANSSSGSLHKTKSARAWYLSAADTLPCTAWATNKPISKFSLLLDSRESSKVGDRFGKGSAMTSSLLAYYYWIRFILARWCTRQEQSLCLKKCRRTAAAEVCIKLKARVHDLRNRLGLLDVRSACTCTGSWVVRRVTLRILILQSRDGVARLSIYNHVDTVHVHSICACEIADFAPKNSSDLHLSRGPPRRRRGVLEPPQPPPWVRACLCHGSALIPCREN